MEFEAFSKIPRLSRECVITEKIDGTNAQVVVADGSCTALSAGIGDPNGLHLHIGSRNRWLSEKEDNYGFFKWAQVNKEELLKLGLGRHYGEWWGSGIQRGYDLPKGEKRFSLFNTSVWNVETKPACCFVVPVLYVGVFDTDKVLDIIECLKDFGSSAVPGFMRPEGLVIYHVAASTYFKKTLERDEAPKGKAWTNFI